MKHIVAALILSLIMSLTHATRPEAKAKAHTKRCHDITALQGASIFIR